MGVPRLFPWLLKNFDSVVETDCITERVDVLLIDANPLLYNAKAKIETDVRNKYNADFLTIDFLFYKELLSIIENIRPKKEVFIALDGVAPVCKQNQQRIRRYMADTSTKINPLWFSPSTKFMKQLVEYVVKQLSLDYKCKTHDFLNNIKVSFSDDTLPGEGEHKCINHIRTHSGSMTRRFAVYGGDGDLIWLTMALDVKHIKVIKDSWNNSGHYYVMDMSAIKKKIQELRVSVPGLVFLASLLGNDFLPKIQMFVFLEDGVDILMGQLIHHPIFRGNTNKATLHDFRDIIGVLKDVEMAMLVEQTDKAKQYLPADKQAMGLIDDDVYDSDTYRMTYYQRFVTGVTEETIDQISKNICKHYVKTMCFVYEYYTSGLPSWNYYYPYHMPPLMCDLHDYLSSKHSIDHTFEMGDAPEPHVQLLSIFPPSASDMVSFLKTGRAKKVLDDLDKLGYYPRIQDIPIEYRGKLNDYEGIVMMPFLNRSVVESSLRSHT
jgi:5'-3' exonuclease